MHTAPMSAVVDIEEEELVCPTHAPMRRRGKVSRRSKAHEDCVRVSLFRYTPSPDMWTNWQEVPVSYAMPDDSGRFTIPRSRIERERTPFIWQKYGRPALYSWEGKRPNFIRKFV